MDLSKFKTSDWLKIGGAAGMLIFGLFAWATLGGVSGGNVFDFTLTGAFPWIMIVGVGVISLLLAIDTIKRNGSLMWDAIILIVAAVAALLVVIRLIIGPKVDVGDAEFEYDRGFGLYLSAISCVVCAVGTYLGFTEHGGNIAKIGDALKKPAAGAADGSMSPPPPPGGMTPPPPPPPPPPAR